jgi:hypothetical protein
MSVLIKFDKTDFVYIIGRERVPMQYLHVTLPLQNPANTVEMLVKELIFITERQIVPIGLACSEDSFLSALNERGETVHEIMVEILKRFEVLNVENASLRNITSDLRSQISSLEDAAPENH